MSDMSDAEVDAFLIDAWCDEDKATRDEQSETTRAFWPLQVQSLIRR